ncbi:MAG: hypothetical protein OEW58_12460 [Gammaproteobacteria bacterium]|nr:hypothetical protein [Gammaproteobacteria bacterium]
MISYRIFFSLLLLLTFSTTQAANFVLQAEGSGDDIAQAKASALTNLSQQVISRVESEFSSDVAVSNADVNKNIRSKKKISSDILFKNVKYVDERKDGNAIRVVAGLDRAAVEDTIKFMREKLAVDLDLLNGDQRQEALLISQQLSALLHSVANANIVDAPAMANWVEARRVELLKRMNQGKVIFVSDVNDYQVEVDGLERESGEFLAQGEYSFVAKAAKHRDISGRFSVSAGRETKIDLPFIEKVEGQKISLEIIGAEQLRAQASETLASLGMQVQPGMKHKLELTLTDDITRVEGFVIHQLKLKLIAYKGEQQTKKLVAKSKLTLQGSDPAKLLATQQQLIGKGIASLMAEMDLRGYFATNE